MCTDARADIRAQRAGRGASRFVDHVQKENVGSALFCALQNECGQTLARHAGRAVGGADARSTKNKNESGTGADAGQRRRTPCTQRWACARVGMR